MTSVTTRNSLLKPLKKLWECWQDIIIREQKIGENASSGQQIGDVGQVTLIDDEPLDECRQQLRAQYQRMAERQRLMECEDEAHKQW